MIEYLCDSSYTIISVLGLLITIENIEKDNFLKYVEHNKYSYIPDYYLRVFIAICGHVFMGHGMYLISTSDNDTPLTISMYLVQLFIGLAWYILFYNFTVLRLSLFISVTNFLICVYNFSIWYRLDLFTSLFMLPYSIISIIHLLLNCNIITSNDITKTQ
ncbi:hypothetical protein [Turkeypox virus]|uniref:Uncharacterized protein n=1 Tax=Turkeypox virus TaxID=336486 RepID=A0A0M3ZJH6_9POXV|nr:hypothetical protein ASN15_gp017 [Turkeypox virus]ALA62391.1 hypothetical protein [Turkeypox virus]